ncbi:MAG: exo-alpha-sialidase, partial [Candidatus Latescibacteria bacterium]|nr:exo-alpha-sialidase [Candidatus Latescibacterota bacterium]
ETCTFIRAQIGRPRLFKRDGNYYFIGRNYMDTIRGMKLCLFKFDPESLDILSYAILDNYEGAVVPDGYYAMPYFTTRAQKVYFNIVTYKSLHLRESPPDLIRLEFKWDELR